MRTLWVCLGVSLSALGITACSQQPETPLSPSPSVTRSLAAENTTANLKINAPSELSPSHAETQSSRRPTLRFRNAAGDHVPFGVAYEIEVYDESGPLVYAAIIGESPEQSRHELGQDLTGGRAFFWRVRARLGDEAGPWSGWADFRTPAPAAAPPPVTPPTGTRHIGLDEAFAIIRRIHDEQGFDLGSRSSRESRVEFLFAAVAAIHFGHPRYNPAGGDPLWCVKDAGGGRPPSDDVIVRCDSRDAWDLIGSAGANGYSFHLDYLGRLPGGQNVYPPPQRYLAVLW